MSNNWLDTQHRAYSAHRAQTDGSDACEKLQRQLLTCPSGQDQCRTTFYDCRISTDWIEQIEQAMPFLENAIGENRQFILKQGETVAIEKVRRVSKTSVEHLSRHSELITRVPEPGADVIPDKLYVTENVGTFAVYENRFLYMLLCELREFLSFRYRKIRRLIATFSTQLDVNRELTDEQRSIGFTLSFRENSTGLPGAVSPETEQLLQRIYALLQQVEQLLKTELMREVSAAPLLHPPISRTNVMLHDPNFQAAFALYSFIDAYTQDGFVQIERTRQEGAPTLPMQEDIARLIAITSYLGYRNGGLLEQLQQRFLSQQIEEIERRQRQQQAHLRELRERLPQLDEASAAYIQELEQWAGELEDKTQLLFAADESRRRAEQKLQQLNAAMEPLQERVQSMEQLAKEMTEQAEQQSQAAAKAEQLAQQAQTQLEFSRQQWQREQAQQAQEFQQKYDELSEKYLLASGCQLAAQAISGIEGEYVTKEGFSQLEAQYLAFRRFYESQWALAKKQIRKDQLQGQGRDKQ